MGNLAARLSVVPPNTRPSLLALGLYPTWFLYLKCPLPLSCLVRFVFNLQDHIF